MPEDEPMVVPQRSARRVVQVSTADVVALKALWCGIHFVRDRDSGEDVG